MNITLACPECAAVLRVPEEHLGEWGTCNKCGKQVFLGDRRILCPGYQSTIYVPEQHAGSTVYCGKCGARIALAPNSDGRLIAKTDEQVERRQTTEEYQRKGERSGSP